MPYFQSESGRQIYFERHGNTGPAVILLHGLASSTRIWIRQVRTLQKTCRVYVLDFPGHGRSDRQHGYSLQELSGLVGELMNYCGIRHADLVAISMGCTVALTFAANHPERVDRLVLEGPIGGYRSVWNPPGWADHLIFGALPIMLRFSIFLFGYHAIAHWINTFGVKAKRNFRVLEAVQHQTDPRAIQDLLWDSACVPYAGILERITAPVMLIRGHNDPVPRRFSDYIRRHLSQVTYVEVPETRHLVALEKPREFNAMVMSFLGLAPKLKETLHEHSA